MSTSPPLSSSDSSDKTGLKEGELRYSKRYTWYVLIMLMVVFTFSHMDRNIVSILLNSIVEDLDLSDTQAGLMAGFAFAIFYATLGLPIARVADRTNRMNIITISLALWSAMTALCGLAQNFWQLLLARMGVGVGEAGCVPPAQSIIADYVPNEKRSFAMSVFSLGVPLGTLLGFVIGGVVSEIWGWREALMVVGLPGVLLAVIVKLTIKEPPRGHADGLVEDTADAPHIKEVARFLWTRKSLKHATLGAALITFGGYGAQTWIPAFFERSHGISELTVGLWLAPVMVAGGVGGSLIAGWLTDKLIRNSIRWYVRVPAIAVISAVPFSIIIMLIPNTTYSVFGMSIDAYIPAILLMMVPGAAYISYLGPVNSLLQRMVGLRMRSITVAVFLFVTNLVGMGLGPVVVGIVSDIMEGSYGVESLRYTMLIFTIIVYPWAAWHFFRAGRYIEDEIKAIEG